MEDHLPERADDVAGEVPGAGRRACREDDEIVCVENRLKRAPNQIRIVGNDLITAAGRPHPGEVRLRHEGVRLDRLTRGGHHAERDEVVSCRYDADPDRPDSEPGYPVGCERAEIERPDPMAFREGKFACTDILPGMPDVLPGRGRLPDPGCPAVVPGILDHDDGVKRGGEYLTGVDAGILAERQRPLILRPRGIPALHRITVELRDLDLGNRVLCVQRFGRHPADGKAERHGLDMIRRRKRPPHRRERFGKRGKVQISA